MQFSSLAFGKTFFYVSWLFILRDDLPAGQIRMFTMYDVCFIPHCGSSPWRNRGGCCGCSAWTWQFEKKWEVRVRRYLGYNLSSKHLNLCCRVLFFFKVHQWTNSLFYAHLWITEHLKRAYHRNLVRKIGKPMGELAQKGQCLQRQLVMSCVLYSRPFWWVFVVLCFWIQATLWLQWTQSWEHSFIAA